MKIKLFIALISVMFSLELMNAQTTYMSVFSDTTRYYTAYGINDGEVYDYLEFKKTNDSTVVPIGVAYPWNNYNRLVVNSSNSKIWGITQGSPAKRLLLMDLDMNVNDQYVDGGGHIHTVDSVYTLNGRKHIRFEKQSVNLAIVDSTYFEFIEGIGNTISFSNFGVFTESSSIGIPWLRSQYKNGTLAYGLPEWVGFWDFIGDETGVKSIHQVTKLYFSPSPVVLNLELEIPKHVCLNKLQLSIYDTYGKQQCLLFPTERKLTLDLSRFSSGIHVLRLNSSNYNESVKFVKL